MTRLLLAFGLATLAGLCYWLATRERGTWVDLTVRPDPWREPWGDC